ncbi:MAG TPA: hypothetical protein VK327_14730, partial [Candidatus Paceibacterota bacterium]|nr:hypothetical protein [Candidatus Paceibacterota bacterium]
MILPHTNSADAARLAEYINVKLSLLGFAPVTRGGNGGLNEILSSLVAQYREKERLLSNHLCPADHRIQTFLYDYLQEVHAPKLPLRTLVLDQPGMARVLSLPVDKDEFVSSILSSYRVKQGVLHNPRSDRRTTQGIFHVTEGGLPVPDDKIGVPKATFSKMLAQAFNPPRDLMRLP